MHWTVPAVARRNVAAATLKAAGALPVLALVALTTRPAFGFQDENARAAAGLLAMGAVFIFFMVIVCIAAYIYMALCLQTIARKTNTPNGWLAWVPIANCILMLNIAQKPLWWIILLFIPLVNIVIGVIVWMQIAKARNKPEWWGILMIVPLANLVAPAYIAWAD
ncbi:MAG TPA: DUF5684 domain-containing protein [Terriglobia bacterium]|nr:DUF5684 domain-containing protein [Terriglobia bacterium]